MKRIKYRRWALLVLLVMLAAMFAMSTNVSAATPKLSSAQKSIYKGTSFTLTASGEKVKSWRSSNASIASVSSSGKVTGKKKGTVKIYATFANKTLNCTVNVRDKNRSPYITNSQMNVMLNVLGAVETGGQVYGQRDYADFTNPYKSSPNEHSSTAGAFQEYGENLRQLLLQIKKEYPVTFKKYDTANIASDISGKAWYDSNPYKVYNGSAKARAIVNIISSPQGRIVQNYRAIDLINSYLKHICGQLGVTNVRAALYMAECEHLGGASPVDRVVKRASNRNSITALHKSLILDQKDKSNSYQIGDKIYQTRHDKCRSWIIQKIPASAKIK